MNRRTFLYGLTPGMLSHGSRPGRESAGVAGLRRDCAEDRNRPQHGLHMNTSEIFPGIHASVNTGSRMIGAVRASPGSLLASASEATDILEIRFRYRICRGVLSWRAPTGDTGGGPGTGSTTSWPPVHGGAIHSSSHAVAARESQRLSGRNPAARPARWLSRW